MSYLQVWKKAFLRIKRRAWYLLIALCPCLTVNALPSITAHQNHRPLYLKLDPWSPCCWVPGVYRCVWLLCISFENVGNVLHHGMVG